METFQTDAHLCQLVIIENIIKDWYKHGITTNVFVLRITEGTVRVDWLIFMLHQPFLGYLKPKDIFRMNKFLFLQANITLSLGRKGGYISFQRVFVHKWL